MEPSSIRSIHDSSDASEQLRMIVDDIHHFLSDFVDRIDEVLESDSMKRSSESRNHEPLDDARRRWEKKCQDEEDRMGQQAEQLTEAWLQLESEQRVLLQSKGRSPEKDPVRIASEPNEVAPQQIVVTPATCEGIQKISSLSINGNPTQDAASKQFQRLRSEIQAGHRKSATR